MVTISLHGGFATISIDGETVAESGTFRRLRTIWNMSTRETVVAPDLTPRNLKAEPARVLGYLEMVGINCDGMAVEVAA